MKVIKVTIRSWERYNPRSDRANHSWLRLQNTFFSDPEVFILEPDEQRLLILMLCEAGKKGGATFQMAVHYAAAILRISDEAVEQAVHGLEHLIDVEWDERPRKSKQSKTKPSPQPKDTKRCLEDTKRCQEDAERHQTVSLLHTTNERTDVTDERNERIAKAGVAQPKDTGDTRPPLAAAPKSPPLLTITPRSTETTKPSVEEMTATGTPVWLAYCKAYWARYGEAPVRNARQNSLCKQIVDRLGAEEAPLVAAYYLTRNDSFYVNKGHAIQYLLNDAEALRTSWKTGRTTSTIQARQQELAHHNANAIKEYIASNPAGVPEPEVVK